MKLGLVGYNDNQGYILMQLFKSYWFQIVSWPLRKVGRMLWLAILGALLIVILVFTLYMNSLPPLSTWHTKILENEFNSRSNVKDFDDYIALEEKLFQELDTEIYEKLLGNEKSQINRYTKNSISDPHRWEKAYNRSYELPVKNPKMGILLLHGMSDSPYSLHAQAEYLQKKGVWVVAMRMPGHGTIPSGLIALKWQDMASVVKIGMERLEEKVGEKPIHIMGYSTGATLALNYTFLSLKDHSLRVPKSLIFYSPAIGVSPVAPLAIWQSRLGHLLNLPKFEWNAVLAEYDPFKYGSFAVNAGDQVYRVCKEVQSQFDTYEKESENSDTFPPVLSFSSIVDNTVTVHSLVDDLYKRLPKGEHRLVLFDIRHQFTVNHLVKKGLSNAIDHLRKNATGENYTFELITDINSTNENLVKIIDGKYKENLSMSWPKNLYSLSHLAMPISPNDPLYGNDNAPQSPGIQLGNLAIHGEIGVLQLPPGLLYRQRWNPFYDYTRHMVLEFLKL